MSVQSGVARRLPMIGRYVEDKPVHQEARIVGILRGCILVGVWVLTALAGLAAWIKLST